MLSYTIELKPRGTKQKDIVTWQGPAVNIIDAIQLAKASVFPDLHTARVIEIGEHRGEPEGNQS